MGLLSDYECPRIENTHWTVPAETRYSPTHPLRRSPFHIAEQKALTPLPQSWTSLQLWRVPCTPRWPWKDGYRLQLTALYVDHPRFSARPSLTTLPLSEYLTTGEKSRYSIGYNVFERLHTAIVQSGSLATPVGLLRKCFLCQPDQRINYRPPFSVGTTPA